MSSLKKFLTENPEYKKDESKTIVSNKINMPVKILSYDPPFFVGERLDTQEQVKVLLEDIEQSPNAEYKRPEINKFMSPRERSYAEPGSGVIIFEGSHKGEDGVWYSRWASTLSPSEEEATVSIVDAKIIIGSREEKKWVVAHILMTDFARKINTKEEFDAAMMSFLRPKTQGSRPYIVMRVSDGETIEVIDIYPAIKEDGGKKYVDSPNVSLNEFYASSKSQIVSALIGKDDVMFELIPATMIYAGKSTKEKLTSKERFRKQLEREYALSNSNEESATPKAGYVKTVIAIRKYDDGTPYISAKPYPLIPFDKAKDITEIDTKNLKGVLK